VQIIDESPAEFPTVSICDSNPFTTFMSQLLLEQIMKNITYMKRNRLGLNSGLYLRQLGFYNYYFPHKEIILSFDVYQYATAYAMDPNFFTDSQRRALGWDLSKVLIKCTFNGVECDIKNEFQWYFSFQYGNCFHFNQVTLEKQVKRSHIFESSFRISTLPMRSEVILGLSLYLRREIFLKLNYTIYLKS
jgi:hypothetical protein